MSRKPQTNTYRLKILVRNCGTSTQGAWEVIGYWEQEFGRDGRRKPDLVGEIEARYQEYRQSLRW